jgi:glutamate-1-semialdehyde 2,1-aminomutase
MIAGYTLLNELNNKPEIYTELAQKTAYLEDGLQQVLRQYNIPFVINRFGSMISIFFSAKPVNNFDDAVASDKPLFNRLFHALLQKGVYLPPSAFESWFLNNALTIADLDYTVNAVNDSLKEIL